MKITKEIKLKVAIEITPKRKECSAHCYYCFYSGWCSLYREDKKYITGKGYERLKKCREDFDG